MNTNQNTQRASTSNGKPSHVRQSFASLAHDALELGELQLRLAKLDAKENAQKLRSTAILAGIGTLVLLSCLPVGLLSLGEWFSLEFSWTKASSLAAAAGCGLVAAALLLGMAYLKLRQGFATWERSSEELQRNVTWLKQTLKPGSATKPATSHPTAPESAATAARSEIKLPPR
ncbi:phage holin family protein [Adhaeretor mobilis]|uniref:Phage holin family protein n=1 Tax=Adhaeretor mobilis TaxID=1930276 RepID=A0A517N1U0_9BACT|nr:phage holin family protein [Adhaeretor mobilis]QDT01104.1 hypothetical protein HG15A2_44460 [Adhaeretor mobilis]